MMTSPFDGPRCKGCGFVCESEHLVRDEGTFCSSRCLWAFWGNLERYMEASRLNRYGFERGSILRRFNDPAPGGPGWIRDPWMEQALEDRADPRDPGWK